MTVLIVTPQSITGAEGADAIELCSPTHRYDGEALVSTAVDKVPVGVTAEITVVPGPLLVRLSGPSMPSTRAIKVTVPDVAHVNLADLLGDAP